jgi:hypothetical protein
LDVFDSICKQHTDLLELKNKPKEVKRRGSNGLFSFLNLGSNLSSNSSLEDVDFVKKGL